MILIGIVATGVGSALTASPAAFCVTTWLGVAYLTWFGAGALVNASRATPAFAPMLRSRRALAHQEFVVAITNPKALLLFAVILPLQCATEVAKLEARQRGVRIRPTSRTISSIALPGRYSRSW